MCALYDAFLELVLRFVVHSSGCMYGCFVNEPTYLPICFGLFLWIYVLVEIFAFLSFVLWAIKIASTHVVVN